MIKKGIELTGKLNEETKCIDFYDRDILVSSFNLRDLLKDDIDVDTYIEGIKAIERIDKRRGIDLQTGFNEVILKKESE